MHLTAGEPEAKRPGARSGDAKFQSLQRKETAKYSVTVDLDLHDKLVQAAAERAMTPQAYLRWALERALGLGPVAQHVDDRSGVRPRRKRAGVKATDKESGASRA